MKSGTRSASVQFFGEFQANQQIELLISHAVPDQPWSKLRVDIFTFYHQNYLVSVDYFKDFFELDVLTDTTAATVINCLKQQFARHGIHEYVVRDNGPQLKSSGFCAFFRDWEFELQTSSPCHSESNGEAESAVNIAKNTIKRQSTVNETFGNVF